MRDIVGATSRILRAKTTRFSVSDKFIYFAVILIILLVTFSNWFFKNTILTQGDWYYYTNATLRSFRLMYFHVWLSDKDFGRSIIDVGQAPTYALYGVLSRWFGLSYQYSERVIHLLPSVLLAPLCSYFYLKLYTKQLLAIAVGTAVYCCNTYFLQLLTGDITIAAAYALAPFILYAYIVHLKNPNVKSAVIAALASFVMCCYEPRVLYVCMIAVLTYTGLSLFYKKDRKVIIPNLSGTFISILPFILLLLMCLYWLLGVYASGAATGQSILSRGLFGSQFFILQNALTIDQPFWTGANPVPFIYHNIFLNQWIIPIGATLGMFINRNKKVVFYFATLLCLGLLLSKQQSEPFPTLYLWLFNNIPGFNAFREASKFYLLIALGASGLITIFVDYILSINRFRVFTFLTISLILVGLLFNLKPFINQQIASTVTARSIPNAYVDWNKFIENQPGFSRVLWVPDVSRWADDTVQHPNVSAAQISQADWQNLIGSTFPSDINTSNTEQQISDIYSSRIAQSLVSAGSIKYIVIPIRDISNDDDFIQNYGNDRNFYIRAMNNLNFLKKLNFNLNGLVVYENLNYKPYIAASNNLIGVTKLSNINQIINLNNSQLNNKNFNFDLSTTKDRFPQVDVQDIFNGINTSNFTKFGIIPTITKLSNNSDTLYANTVHPTLNYTTTNGSFVLYETNSNELLVNNSIVGKNNSQHEIFSEKLTNSKQYYTSQDNNLIPIQYSKDTFLGAAKSNLKLLDVDGPNIVPDASLGSSFWQKKVGDCNNYDDNPEIAMNFYGNTSVQGTNFLQLLAGEHTACAGPNPLNVTTDGYYDFGFNYLAKGSDRVGYILKYNDKNHTVIRNQIDVTDQGQWIRFDTLLQIPNGSTKVSIQLLGFPEETLNQIAITNYDDLRFTPLNVIFNAPIDISQSFTKINVNPSTRITYSDKGISDVNLIPNALFKNSLWQKTVSDCDDYDSKPQIGMKFDKNADTNGDNALELDAAHHIACSGPKPINLQENSKVFLSFDYQSPNGTDAGFHIQFNDPAHTVDSQQIPIINSTWKNYNTILSIPDSATQMNLTVYSYANNLPNETVITRYANFHLINIPDIQGSYFMVSQPKMQLRQPKTITYKLINPTERLIHVSGATTSFYLNMSEAYDANWKLEINNSKVKGLESWLPFYKPNVIPNNDHYELDDYLNGWYVDVNQLCRVKSLCLHNKDGSYDINMLIEFAPQRWFNLGLVVSGSVFTGCIFYLIFIGKHNKKYIYKQNR